ncbi:MAG: shikimate dehydrogenase [Nitrososphaeria archaeon]
MTDSSTALYCLIGDPVSGSLSPEIHTAAYAAMGLNATYLAFRVTSEALSAAIGGLRVLAKGFNVTIPHKTRVALMMDELTHEASLIGAVNAVAVRGGSLVGHNTDALAASDVLEALGARGGTATIVGAGGAAKSVVYALWRKGFSEVRVLDRTPERAEALASGAKAVYGLDAVGAGLTRSSLLDAVSSSNLLVNATPLGMYGGELEVPEEALHGGLAVMDLAYTRGETGLIRLARSRGLRAADGLEFLVIQAAHSIEFWTGMRPPVDVMRRAALEAISGHARQGRG